MAKKKPITGEEFRSKHEQKFGVHVLEGREVKQFKSLKPAINDEDLSQETFISVPILANSNVPSLTRMAWDVEELQAMGGGFKDKPITQDHSNSVGRQIGVVYDVELVTFQSPSKNLVNMMIQESEIKKESRELIRQDGLHLLLLYGAIPFPSIAADTIISRAVQDVSTTVMMGNQGKSQFLCGRHKTPFEQCGCIPPDWYTLRYEYPRMDKAMQQKVAPFFVRKGIHIPIEVSLVQKGDALGAEIISAQCAEILLEG